MLDKTLAKALKYSWIIGTAAGLICLLFERRILPAVLLGNAACTVYSLMLNTNIVNMTNPSNPNMDGYNGKRVLRLSVLGIAMAIPFIFPGIFMWYGTVLAIFLFRGITVFFGTNTK
ncbi:MAG: hypothetical protein IIZ48_07090 [Erysipelotrichales bacterium]|nr:hypothetical protein [Erysipelotrichales bacterium]